MPRSSVPKRPRLCRHRSQDGRTTCAATPCRHGATGLCATRPGRRVGGPQHGRPASGLCQVHRRVGRRGTGADRHCARTRMRTVPGIPSATPTSARARRSGKRRRYLQHQVRTDRQGAARWDRNQPGLLLPNAFPTKRACPRVAARRRLPSNSPGPRRQLLRRSPSTESVDRAASDGQRPLRIHVRILELPHGMRVSNSEHGLLICHPPTPRVRNPCPRNRRLTTGLLLVTACGQRAGPGR